MADTALRRSRVCLRARPRVAAVLVTLAALVGGGWAGAGAASGATGPEYYGTNLGTIGFVPDEQRGPFFDQLAAGRMNVNRIQIDWRVVEATAPQDGQHTYDWSSTDAFIGVLAARGIRTAPLFRFSPGWAHVSAPGFPNGTDVLPPASYGDYAAMVTAFAKRYGPGGRFWASRPSLPARPTLTYEVWNEANLDEYAWNGRADPGRYAALLREVRRQLRAAVPSAVVMGSLAWQTEGPGVYPDFVAGLHAAGGLDALDAIGYHPYAPDAQSVLDLVTGLRRSLAAVGRPDLPIYANETGQPAVLDGPGAQYAWAGRPSDAARAANVSFAGDALAASDCSVEQFLLYTIVGTETDLEPIGEGYMGMLRRADGSPNLTGQALQRASRRWAARFDAGGPGPPARLSLCSPGPTPAEALLPIEMSAIAGAPGCLAVNTRYDGNPLESAVLRFRDPATGAEVAQARTDAFGNASQCVPDTLRGRAFTAYADIAGAGRSAVVECDVPGIGCLPGALAIAGVDRFVASAQPGAQPAVQAAPPPACTWRFEARAERPRRARRGQTSSITVRLQSECETAPKTAKVSVSMWLGRGAKGKFRRVRTVQIPVGARSRTVLKASVRKGDRLQLRHLANQSAGIPALRRQLKLAAPVRR